MKRIAASVIASLPGAIVSFLSVITPLPDVLDQEMTEKARIVAPMCVSFIQWETKYGKPDDHLALSRWCHWGENVRLEHI